MIGISLLDSIILDRKDYIELVLMSEFISQYDFKLAFDKWRNSLNEDEIEIMVVRN